MFQIDTIEIIGLIAAVLTTASFVPQAYKSWKTKDVKGLSLTMYVVLFTGVVLWVVYGIYLQSISIILANIVTGVLVFALLALKIKHRHR